MKKGILKLMTAAVVATGLASCSDDLGLSSNYGNGAKGDLTGHINEKSANFTRLGMSENFGPGTIMPWEATYDEETNPTGTKSTWKWVFTEGDVVRAFSLKQMTWSSYDLIDGFNTSDGVFKLNEKCAKLEDPELYALTDAQFVYSVSPDVEGNAWLTYTIPYRYGAQTITPSDKANTDVRKFPAPFWGKAVATEVEGGEALDVKFNALTGFLRIESNVLPAGTKYIVLTTHGSAVAAEEPDGTTGEVTYDGFQLAEPQANGEDPVGFKDIDSWWNKDDGSGNPVNAQLITDGNSEALSGTFTTMLKDDKSALGVDEGLQNKEGEDADDWMMEGISRLVTRDEIIIDITKYNAKENGVFWVPLIAQHYNNLHVIAATKLSKNYAYRYIGNELKVFTDQTVGVGDRLLLNVNVTNLGKCDVWTLNKTIQEINKANKYGVPNVKNVINVDKLLPVLYGEPTTPDGYYYRKDGGNLTSTRLRRVENPERWETYPCDKIYVQGTGDLVVNIAALEENASAVKWGWYAKRTDTGFGENAANLLVSDISVDDLSRRNYQGVQTAGNHNVRINVPRTLKGMVSDLPQWDVTIAANTEYAPADATELQVWAHGSKEKFVTGHDLVQLDPTDPANAVLKNSKVAAIEVVNGIQTLTVLEHTKGDVYVNDNNGTKVEVTDGIYVKTQEGLKIRIDNALVRNLGFQEYSRINNAQRDNYVFTIGSAAIAKVGVEPAMTAKPNQVTLKSYWTGKALDKDQPNINLYDNGTIYTVAQLASAGEKIGEDVSKYKVDDLVTKMWLGSSTLQYEGNTAKLDNGWIGANVKVDNFEFDGNGKSLENMYMPQNGEYNYHGNKRVIYKYDPHFCCTTCGFNRPTTDNPEYGINESQKIAITSWGLFRSIINNTANVVKNIQLNDVNAIGELDSIGAVVGKVEAKSITFTNNQVGEVRILAKGDYHGGMAGDIQTTAATRFEHNWVGNNYGSEQMGIVKGTNYVGGFAGRIGKVEQNANPTQNARYDLSKGVGALIINDAHVNLKNYITGEEGDFVGGLVGGAYSKTSNTITKSDVTVAKYINSDKGSVGGIAGELFANNGNALNTNSVKTKDITAKNSYAGGIAGRSYSLHATGLVSIKVEAENIKTTGAGAYFVGGYMGHLEAESSEVSNADIKVTKEISTKEQYAGGVAGEVQTEKQIKIYNGDIVVNKIEAIEGNVGGEIGAVTKGNAYIGKNTINDQEKLITNIDIEELSGGYAVGGVVGNIWNNSEVNVFTRRGDETATGDPVYYSKIYIDVKEFTNPQADLEAYFADNNVSDEKAGSHSNIAGMLDGTLRISEAFLYVNDYMTGDMKEAVGYKLHHDNLSTPGVSTRSFWGDYNGYVGTGKSGQYFLSPTAGAMADPLNKVTADQYEQKGWNIFLLEGNYNEYTSKNFGNAYEAYPAGGE